MDLIFFGMQGAGKGTIGKAIAREYSMEIFETGGELRRLANEDSELGKKVKSIIEAGHLVPNEVVMEIVGNFMNRIPEKSSILFDGIPRKVEQAHSLNKLLDNYKRHYKAVLLEIREETALKRLTTRRVCEKCKAVYPADYREEKCKCGGELTVRQDDNPEAIKTRLQAFKDETIPAIELYKNDLIKIDGEPPINEVEKLAFRALSHIMG